MEIRTLFPVGTWQRLLAWAILAMCALAGSASAALRVTVRPGDTLSGIAANHGVSTGALAQFNGLSNADMLSIGRVLAIPGGGVRVTSSGAGTYTVRPGDTLSGIAARFGVSAGTIARQNGIGNVHVVVVGSRLRISGTAGPVRTATWIGGSRYTVRAGDTLGGIAARLGTSASALARANGITNPNALQIGTQLRVSGGGGGGQVSSGTSSGGTYTVQAGDNLGAIAARYGTSAQALAQANGLSNPNVVVVGTRLRVPGRSAGSSTPSSGPLTPITAAGSGWGNHPSRATVASLMANSAARHGVDVSLVRAVGWQESGWWQGARSSTGAIGVMQLMPTTAAWLGPALLGRQINPYSVSDNIDAGTAYLAYLQRQTGSRRLAIASYYQGLGSVTTRGLLGETESYVASVSAFIGKV
jgi:N-acetylmuramoyl-L-alanine amidase